MRRPWRRDGSGRSPRHGQSSCRSPTASSPPPCRSAGRAGSCRGRARSHRHGRAPSRAKCWCRRISAPPPARPRGDSSWSATDRDDRPPARSRRSGSRRSASGRRTAARGSDRSRARSRARHNCGRCSRCGGPGTRRSRRRSGSSSSAPRRSASGRLAPRPARLRRGAVSASAPVASSVRRSSEVMAYSLRCYWFWPQRKGPCGTRAFSAGVAENLLSA